MHRSRIRQHFALCRWQHCCSNKQEDPVEVEKRFKAMGFNRVYPPGIKIEDVIGTIKEDLGGI